jgi:hypothetical protein
MELYFKEEDIEYLDRYLDCIAEKGAARESFIRKRVLPKEIPDTQYYRYLDVLVRHCAIPSNMDYGNERTVMSDSRTSIFKENGGFRSYYERFKENEEICAIQNELARLQKDDLEHKRRIRTQESVIRFWQLATAIVGIAGAVGWLLSFLK